MMKEELMGIEDHHLLSNHIHPYPILASNSSTSSHNSVENVDIKLKKRVRFEDYSHVYYFGRTVGQSTIPIQGIPLGMERYHFQYSYEPLSTSKELYDLHDRPLSAKRSFQLDSYQRKRVLEESTDLDFFQLLSSMQLSSKSQSSTSSDPFDFVSLSNSSDSNLFFDYSSTYSCSKEDTIEILKEIEMVRKSRSELPLCGCAHDNNSSSKCGDPSVCYCAYHQIGCHDWCLCKSKHNHDQKHSIQQSTNTKLNNNNNSTSASTTSPIITSSSPSLSNNNSNNNNNEVNNSSSTSSKLPFKDITSTSLSSPSVFSSKSPSTSSSLSFQENTYSIHTQNSQNSQMDSSKISTTSSSSSTYFSSSTTVASKRKTMMIRAFQVVNCVVFGWLFINSFTSMKEYLTIASPEL